LVVKNDLQRLPKTALAGQKLQSIRDQCQAFQSTTSALARPEIPVKPSVQSAGTLGHGHRVAASDDA